MQLIACTGIRLISKDGGVVYGRTMEWGSFDLHSRVAIIPRGYSFTGLTPDGLNGKVYKSKYGVVGLDMIGKDYIGDGMNEKGFYGKHLSHFFAPQVNWPAAIFFYLLFIIGIFIFGILPAVERQSWIYALVYGGLFGFFAYATYDLTNLATLNDWPIKVVVVDVIWGFVLTASVSVSGYFVSQWLLR